MKIGREELEDLKEGLEKLTHFIRVMEGVKLPDFYRYFDAMKNNINIFFYAGCEDIGKGLEGIAYNVYRCTEL